MLLLVLSHLFTAFLGIVCSFPLPYTDSFSIYFQKKRGRPALAPGKSRSWEVNEVR